MYLLPARHAERPRAGLFFPSPTSRNRHGIDKTDWIRIDRATYDTCLDRRDYRRGLPADRVLEP